jgi:hypothetical protein
MLTIANTICGIVSDGSRGSSRCERPLRSRAKKPSAPARLNAVSRFDSDRSISPSTTSACCTAANSR